MTTKLTLDRAGRVLIPKSLRQELHLDPSDALQLDSEGEEITLRPVRPKALLKKEKGVWVYQGEPTHASIPDLSHRPRSGKARERVARMKEFFDTSVLVGAFWRGHPQHDTSLKLVSAANRKKSACAAHTLAEVYTTMTALPVKDVIPPDQALLFVQEVRDRCAIVALTEDDYFETIERVAACGFSSGRVYDALL